MTRIVIELRGDGPMTGTFLAEGKREATPFSGWMELLALLEAARAHTLGRVAETTTSSEGDRSRSGRDGSAGRR